MINLQNIYISALRYALGRRSYIVSDTIDTLMKVELSEQTIGVMIRDIEECEDYGMEMDKQDWLRLLDYLKTK